LARTILFVGGGVETITGVVHAKEMGLHVVVSDANPTAPAIACAHDAILASTYDIEATLAAAGDFHRNRRRLDGVICLATDVPLTVATVAHALGLPGIPIESARLSTDKLAMKERFAAAGIPIPWFSEVESAEHLRTVVAERGFPLVLKPVDSRGARGVLLLRRDVNIDWAYAESRRNSPTARVMVERFLAGPQVSTESLILGGVAHTPGFADRNYEFLERFAPHIIENGGNLPSDLPDSTRAAVRDLVQRATSSMGVSHGVIKGDIVISNGVPHVIELATRLSGGYFCTHEIPFNTGVDLIGSAILLALGDRVDAESLRPRYDRPIVQRYLFPSAGTVTAVEGAERYSDHPDVVYLEVRVKEGDIVRPIDSHPTRSGVVMTTGKDRDAAIALAEEVVCSVRIHTRAL
jgi:biotin carboxylase